MKSIGTGTSCYSSSSWDPFSDDDLGFLESLDDDTSLGDLRLVNQSGGAGANEGHVSINTTLHPKWVCPIESFT